ncbi:MAG: hypothetical protein ACKVY0_01150 [Prosthecobacter sp.]|uniref:hypothetical protein n=1 Tax=Prosthecobacter sp. TaxID=1965333 RepID=UPI0039019319
MARQQQTPLTPKEQALQDLEAARASLAHHATLAVEEWSPHALVARSIEKHRALWMGGAALAGLALIKLVWPNNRRDNLVATAKNRGLLALLLSPLLALGRKSILNYGTRWLESYLHKKASPNAPDLGTV